MITISMLGETSNSPRYLTIFIALNITAGMWSENMVGETRIWSKLAFSAQIAW